MNEWRPVGRPATRAQVDGDIPDVHVITVRERRVTVDYPTIIQNNVNTDTIELDLDGEWDDMSVVLVLGPCGVATELAWHGEPLTLPAALAEDTGGIDVSVVGYSADGDTRLVTVAAPSLLNVIKSGCTVGEAPGDETPDLIGQLVAAGDAANKAAQSANAAATSASKAAGAANTAASAANTAAGKANDAATKATDAATKATDAAGEATRAAQSANAAAEAASAAAEAARGNVLKGTLGPAHVLSADDAYATKPRRLTVYGNTRQNLWSNGSATATKNGITVTPNSDGSISVNGTSTSSALIHLYASYALTPGTQYTISVDKMFPMNGSKNSGGFFVQRAIDGQENSTIAYLKSTGSGKESFTVPAETEHCIFGLQVVEGATVSGTYRIMLNEGSTAEPWCPPGLNSVDELSVVCAGKNLLKINSDLQAKTINGLTFTPNEDGTVTVNGTATANNTDYYVVGTSWTGHAGTSLPASDLVFSSNGRVKMYGYDSDGAPVISVVLNNGQSQIAASKAQACAKMIVYLSYANGHGETNKDVYVQLELGSTATAYEPPNITTTPVDLDGHTINSLPDGTRDELRIDGTGAVTLTKRTGVATYDGSEDEAWEYTGNRIRFNNGAPGSDSIDEGGANGRCDTLPVGDVASSPAIRSYNGGLVDIRNDAAITDAESGKVWLAANHTTLLYPLATPQTIPLTAVTLPTLPSPNITVYHDSDVPSDMTVEYERDVTIAFDKLQAQVSATTVREATNG